jgi:hypothetical protein
MSNGLNRFTYFLKEVESLLVKASSQKNAAVWLYKNNARTPFFMLEGLAKLYAELHNKKKFTKLKEHFKLIEDGIGAIDYYQSLSNHFAANKLVPTVCKTYFKKMVEQKANELNAILVDKDWLSTNKKRLTKIQKKLGEVEWLNEKVEIAEVASFYGEAIYSINEFVTKTKFIFDNVEEDVHELRRKLRWLSIYPQASKGAIQLAYSKNTPANFKKYLTKDVINSPFNKLPPKGTAKEVLTLNKNNFLALSWLIAKLGNLKDEGLIITGLKEAIQQTHGLTDEEAYKKAYEILGNKYKTLPKLLKEAETVTKVFFSENVLESLVVK